MKTKTVFKNFSLLTLAIIASMALAGCDNATNSENANGSSPSGDSASGLPVFSLAWSEYPSWSVFGVADSLKLINKKEGELGSIEEKWKVDIVLREADYDTCIQLYGATQVDAACLTNMDALNPALSRPSTIILPTSTSHGADACIVADTITGPADLKGKKVYGLEKTVSEYCFVRNIEERGLDEKDFNFTNMDPGAAAAAMQQKQSGMDAIVVWNPFVLQTLANRSDVKVLFDSTSIPNEIIDTVVMSQDSLKKEGGEAFACAIVDAFYQVNARLHKPETRDDTLIAIGEKFSNLDIAAMNKVVEQTKFYGSPGSALELLNNEDLPNIMNRVMEFCVSHGIIASSLEVAYGSDTSDSDAKLKFDSSYITKVMQSGQ